MENSQAKRLRKEEEGNEEGRKGEVWMQQVLVVADLCGDSS